MVDITVKNTHNMKCLIVDEMHESIIPMLIGIGIAPDYKPFIKRDEILQVIAQYEGLFIRSKMSLDTEFFEQAKKLKFIARAGAGMDKIDLKYIDGNKIVAFNSPEGNANALAEHALAMILGLMNSLYKSRKEISQNIWDREGNRGTELTGKKVGIIGLGHMGKAFAEKLLMLGCRVMAYDVNPSVFADTKVLPVLLDELIKEAEVISVHIPKTKDNISFIGEEFFKKISKPIWFINTARGEVVDTSALINALDRGLLRGVGLDVYENEKLSSMNPIQRKNFNYLLKQPNVMISPHVAGWTYESYEKINQVLVSKLEMWMQSKGMSNQ
jgi:D-3-phosphoglycerate dehydrogenase